MMALTYYLRIDGVKGESTQKGHEGEIELEFCTVPNHHYSPTAFKEVIIWKKPDTTSPWFVDRERGRDLTPAATVTVWKEGAASWHARLKLANFRVARYRVDGQGPLEQIFLECKDIKPDPHSTAPPKLNRTNPTPSPK